MTAGTLANVIKENWQTPSLNHPVLKASLPKNTRRSSCFLPTHVPLADVIMSSDKISPSCQFASADETKSYKSNWISEHRRVEIYALHMKYSKGKIYSDTEVINLRGSCHISSWWTASCLMLKMINRKDTNWLLNATFVRNLQVRFTWRRSATYNNIH